MKVGVIGTGHLADTFRQALPLMGLRFAEDYRDAALLFVADDVVDHDDVGQMEAVSHSFTVALNSRQNTDVPVVVVSQVPPGWTRRVCDASIVVTRNVFYQVDTIIVKSAVSRVVRPEQIIIGCADPETALPLAYQAYIVACGDTWPVLQMSYESAELAKCAINYALASQIETACTIAEAAKTCGADYDDVERALRNDARVGRRAYLRPGQTNQHLDRDVETICRLLPGEATNE